MRVEPPCLFVYGTLQPGRLRWPFLEPFALGATPATVAGLLYDTGQGWPAATFDEAATDLIPGTLVELDPARAEEALALMDEIEETADEVFVRVVVTTSGGRAAWAYHSATAQPGMTRIPRWSSTDER